MASMTECSPRYVELNMASAFSFLEGASMPEALAERAAQVGLKEAALMDVRGVYGAPRFFRAARSAGLRPLVGAQVDIIGDDKQPAGRLGLLVMSRAGYQTLCRLLTLGARAAPKGEARVTWHDLAAHTLDLVCLSGGDDGLLARAVDSAAAQTLAARLKTLFEKRFYLELQRHMIPAEERRNQLLIRLARQLDLPLVATNGVRYAQAPDKEIADVFTCLRLHTTLRAAGSRLECNRERHLKSAADMSRLFSDLPEAIAATGKIADQLDFTLDDLGYEFPAYPLAPGETPMAALRRLVWAAAPQRFPQVDEKVRLQLERELNMIAKLELAGYFLIVWDIVQFCLREGIFVQGRGSAANSAVCFALSITAVDPIKMDLLFERFLSEERGEWPDIDLDLPSGEQRERVIQHLYRAYGPHGAAMTANVITYQPRSALREAAKVLDFPPDTLRLLSVHVAPLAWEERQTDRRSIRRGLIEAGLEYDDPAVQRLLRLWQRLQGLPRHLGQHSGGMVIACGRLDHLVPLEPASMPGRVVIQWDKEDCADLGIIKVDLLGLGMLQVLEEAIGLIGTHEGKTVDLARLPADDPQVYGLLRKADTIGLFQVESRAQMASLPHHPPACFYDLVTQVALIRPGPIQGGMMHPFYRRFQGKEPVRYPHPLLEPILKRTLGVPLFQEQVLRIAIEAAGFSGGEAEALRRAMGWKRSQERMEALEERLRAGMAQKGIPPQARDSIVHLIFGFAAYGFPESHAASFALIAYASAYLKVHHPAAFYAALLNAWPMGFYHPATLVKDAQRHGITVDPIDVQSSRWDCRWVSAGGFQLGLRFVKGFSRQGAMRIEQARQERPFRDPADLAYRCQLRKDELERLAYAGGMASFGLTRRAALWQAAQLGTERGDLFERLPVDDESPLPEMSRQEETRADYASAHLTAGPHLMQHLRAELIRRRIDSTQDLRHRTQGATVRSAGCVIVRQQPGTAKGFVFLTLEDEFGMVQAIVSPPLFQRYRHVIVGSSALLIEGVLQKDEVNVSILLRAVERLAIPEPITSKDFS